LQDYELIAQQLSSLGEKVIALDERLVNLEEHIAEVERVNTRLEDAALTTARSLAEISGHWDAVYEAMRRRDTSQEADET
jgi:uncharacterized coiled-coil protein SlyX